jgi:hypothetical protein
MTEPATAHRPDGADDATDEPGVLARTAFAIRVVTARPDTRIALALGTSTYLVLYSVTTGAISVLGGSGASLQVVADPLSRLFESTGFLTFEPIARLQVAGLSYLFSPVDAAIATLLAVLVGLNLAVTYLGLVQPRACGLAPSSGLLASVPALLSGAACCGPVIFVALGIQATGALFAGVQLLLPLSVVLLAGSLLLVGQRIDPTLLDDTPA